MKLQTFQGVWLALAAGVWALAGIDAAAQVPPVATNAPKTSETSATATNKPVKLSHGVADVLKLSQAQVGEDVILTYIANSGRTYNLSATEIVYLREQGVSDAVLSAMLNQRNQVAAAQAQAEAAQAQAVPATQEAATDYAVTQEATTAPSTVYVVPDSSAYYYTDPYWGYPPGVSFSFGIPLGPGPRPKPPRIGPGPGPRPGPVVVGRPGPRPGGPAVAPRPGGGARPGGGPAVGGPRPGGRPAGGPPAGGGGPPGGGGGPRGGVPGGGPRR